MHEGEVDEEIARLKAKLVQLQVEHDLTMEKMRETDACMRVIYAFVAHAYEKK